MFKVAAIFVVFDHQWVNCGGQLVGFGHWMILWSFLDDYWVNFGSQLADTGHS